jgi:hypothetical protein
MTNSMVIPWVGAADVAYDGEHHVIYPEMKKDFMDFWSLERLRVDVPSQWGVAVNFMHEYQGGPWDPVVFHMAKRSYFAAVMLHDALPTGNNNGHARNLVDQRHNFGIGDDDVTFLPYWEKTGLVAHGEDVKLAGWLKPRKLLLLVANFGEKQTAEVVIDPKQLGWGQSRIVVTDAELGYRQTANQRVQKTPKEIAAEKAAFEQQEAALQTKNPGRKPRTYRENPWRNIQVTTWDGDDNGPVRVAGTRIRVPVERHNYRLLVVEKDSPAG